MNDLEMMINDLEYQSENSIFTEGGFFEDRKFEKLISVAANMYLYLYRFKIGIEKDGAVLNVDRSRYKDLYHYLDPQEFLNAKGGLAYDYACFEMFYLKRVGYFPKLFYMEIPGTGIDHAFVIFPVKLKKTTYYVLTDSFFKNYGGMYRATDVNTLFKIAGDMLLFENAITSRKSVHIRLLDTQPRDYGCNYADMIKYMRSGKVVMNIAGNQSKKENKMNSSKNLNGISSDELDLTASSDLAFLRGNDTNIKPVALDLGI